MAEITVCTTYSKKKQASPLMESAKMVGMPVEVFGLDRQFTTFLETKIIPLLTFVRDVQTELVMFIDGSDAFVRSPLKDIVKTYRAMADGEVVVGAERVIWPYPELAWAVEDGLDTGLVIGPKDAVAKALQEAADSVERSMDMFPGRQRAIYEDDVGLWSVAIANGRIKPVVDRKYRLIAALRNTEDSDYIMRKGRLTMRETGNTPHIIHCNGHRSRDRSRLYRLYKELLGEKCPAKKVPTKKAK